MSKIGLIIGREIKSKLSNKTFIVMTFLTPLIFVGAIAMIFWTSMPEKIEQNLLVVDQTGIFKQSLKGNDYISLTFSDKDLIKAQEEFPKSKYSSILLIDKGSEGTIVGRVRLLYKKHPGLAFKTYIRQEIENIYYEYRLEANNIDPSVIINARQGIEVMMEPLDEKGATKGSDSIQFLSFAMGLIMMLFILMYGMMVFRSVMEEKTNRIVEVIVSSVKPFELMIGKIIGVAILGVIQFVATAILTGILSLVLSGIFLKEINELKAKFDEQNEKVMKMGTNAGSALNAASQFKDNQKMFDAIKDIQKIPFGKIAVFFVLFFIGGYLFYSSLLAAIGSAVDSESDSQQFMLPIMIPLMIGYFLAIKIMISPESNAVIIGSFVPFTSPIVMMARMPYNPPMWEVITSLLILYISFIVTAWLAGKIYRTGILMYGKKTSWREIGKWLFYK